MDYPASYKFYIQVTNKLIKDFQFMYIIHVDHQLLHTFNY